MKKKLSALLATVILSSSLFIPVGATAAFSDVTDDNSYKEAITTLSKLSVINGYDDGTFGPEKAITRAEFTKLIVYMLGYGDLSTPITTFEDVALTHWANANIKTAFDLGIINGYSDTEFGPDDPVTYEQALKMVVCTLGYQSDAEAKGGYPEGYRSEAVTLNLNKGIKDASYTEGAPRGLVAQIMYNALEVKLREKNGSKWETTEKNILNDYLKVYKLKGTVVGIEDSTTADCQTKLFPGQFAIDEDKTGTEYVMDYTEYTKSFTDMSDYLGKTVQIYYRQENLSDDKWLVEIDSETYTNKEITVSSLDISEYSDLNLKYYQNGATRTSTIKFDKSDFTVRYNGRAVTENVKLGDKTYTPIQALDEWLNPDSLYFIYGSARIIDSGADSSYNIIDIYDFENIVAYTAPVSPDYRIADKTITGKYVILDPEANDYKISLKKNGSEAKVTSIAAGNVVSYAKNLDEDFYTVYVSSDTVTGTITNLNINNDNSIDNTISIDNVEYHVTDRFLAYIIAKEQKTLETGVSITAYKDFLGSLEWGTITKSVSYYPYAYVVDASEENEEVYLKLYAPTNTNITSLTSSTSYKVKSYKVQDNNPKLNSKKSSPTAILSALKANAEACNLDSAVSGVKLTGYNQLIKVGFTGGQISNVILMDPYRDGDTNEEGSSLVRFKAMDPDKKYYVTSSSVKASSSGATYYSIKSTTPLFVIPKDRSASDSYSIKSAVTSNSMTAGQTYYLDAYDLNTTKYPTVLLVYDTNFKSGTAITYTTAYRLLSENVKEEYDEKEGSTYSVISTYNSTSTLSKTNVADTASSLFSGLLKGDVILNGTDGDKMADSLMVAVRYKAIKEILKGEPIEVSEGEYETYNWKEEQTQTAENNWQKYVFDFRYPKSGITAPTDNYYETGGNVTDISSRAFMCNVMQVLPESNLLYVTQDGFDEFGLLNEDNYMEIKTSSSTKVIRYDADDDKFTPYVKGSESTTLGVQDLKDAENYGSGCSKILLTYVSGSTSHSTSSPTAKFIVIYE